MMGILIVIFPFAKRVAIAKGSRGDSMISVQDIAMQSQALINVKDSIKV